MDNPQIKPGATVDVQCLGAEQQTLLVKTHNIKIVHFVIPVGQTIPTHEAQGEIILHCLQGRVSLAALGTNQELKAGQLSYFCVDEPVSIQAIEHASLIVTIIAAKEGENVELIGDKE